jgi:hypothetical protein
MELDHAILADVVSHRPDGKLDIHGAGFDTLFASSTPAVHPRLDLVVRVLFSIHEVESPHTLLVVLVTADGDELARMQAEVPAMPPDQRPSVPAGHRIGLAFVLSIANVVFPDYGNYHIAIHMDGRELREPMRLYVRQGQDAS